jgi:hypothetical protein
VYDLRDRTFSGMERESRLINLTTDGRWAWDCCSVQVQDITYKVGLQSENRIVFRVYPQGHRHVWDRKTAASAAGIDRNLRCGGRGTRRLQYPEQVATGCDMTLRS